MPSKSTLIYSSCCLYKRAEQNPAVVDEYLDNEVKLDRIAEVPQLGVQSKLQVSPFGVIPKKHKPGKRRLIVDLSAPEGANVNDGIDKGSCSLSYVSIDDITECILQY